MKIVSCAGLVLGLVLTSCQNESPVSNEESNSLAKQLQSEEIMLTVDKIVYTADETVRVELLNHSDAPLFLEGCSQLQIGTKADTGWAEAPLIECVWEGFAVKIPADSSYTLDWPAKYLRGTHRFVAHLYFGCEEDKPISGAQCERRETIYSPEFSVRNIRRPLPAETHE